MKSNMSALVANSPLTSPKIRARMVDMLRQQGISDPDVLEAMNEVPRHAFVDEGLASRAYQDTALPIGFSQTISKPYIVAKMIELLRFGRQLGKVLEIGTGCGYQTAVLSLLAKDIHTVERIDGLAKTARERLSLLQCRNVMSHDYDGTLGVGRAAPFDSIIVSAAAAEIPEPLLKQLAIGGRMVLPVGVDEQQLYVVDLTAEGFQYRPMSSVKFVPLISK